VNCRDSNPRRLRSEDRIDLHRIPSHRLQTPMKLGPSKSRERFQIACSEVVARRYLARPSCFEVECWLSEGNVKRDVSCVPATLARAVPLIGTMRKD